MILHYLNENFHIQQHDLELEPFQPRHKNIIINVTDNENNKIDYSSISSQLTPLEHLLLENRLNIFCIIKANFSECNRIIKLQTETQSQTVDFIFFDNSTQTPIPEQEKQIVFSNSAIAEFYEYTTTREGILSINTENIQETHTLQAYRKSDNLLYKFYLVDNTEITLGEIMSLSDYESPVQMVLTDSVFIPPTSER